MDGNETPVGARPSTPAWELIAQYTGFLICPSPLVLLVLRLQACIPRISPGALSLHAFWRDAWERRKLFHLGHTRSWLTGFPQNGACTLSNLTLGPCKHGQTPRNTVVVCHQKALLSKLKDLPKHLEWLSQCDCQISQVWDSPNKLCLQI